VADDAGGVGRAEIAAAPGAARGEGEAGGPPVPEAEAEAAPKAEHRDGAVAEAEAERGDGAVAEPAAEDGAVLARNVTRGTVLGRSLGVAESFAGRFMGLMGRAGLPPGGGLWLRPASSIHMLFMRFAIDAVFLARPEPDGARRVVAVRANLRPWIGVVWWARGADGCLELPAGTAAATGTVAGDVVRLEALDRAG
jgi:uncharacterized membrane protein (UPF0127 family)